MNAPLTVFICGTYSDLSAERGAILDAIQRLQLQFHSMEFFGARPERPIETCLSEVRESDVVVVIVGRRYGTLVPAMGISYSQAEYEEAYRLKRPCLIYVREGAPTDREHCEQDPHKVELLTKWKAILTERHTPAYFRETTKLAVQVAVDLARTITSLQRATTAPTQKPDETTHHTHKTVALHHSQLTVRSCQRFGDEARQLLYGLVTDPTGNLIVAGGFWGNIDFGKSKLASRGGQEIFLAKFDPSGNAIWSKRYGEGPEQVVVGLNTDAAGAIYLVSSFMDRLDFGGGSLLSKGRYNIALAKLDQDGTHVWSRRFGDSNYHVPEGIAVEASGRSVIAGRFQGSVDFGRGEIKSESNQTDVFLASFASDGGLQWAKRFGGPYEQQSRSLAIDANGNVALVGVFKGSIAFDSQTLAEAQPGDYCGFLAKVDGRGQTLWAKRFGEPAVEQGSVVSFDRRNGDILAAGFMRNKLPSEVARTVGSVCLLARYDPAGVLRWSKAFGTHAFASSISLNPQGLILLTGYFEGSVDFGLGELVSAGGYDLFAAILTPDGHPLWSARFGDPRHLCVANSDSCGGWGLKQAIAVLSPAIRVKVCGRGRECAAPLRRCRPRQSGMTTKLVVKHLVVLELSFEIALVPKPNQIQIFAPDGSDQSLDESVRTWGAGNGLDLIDFEHSKVRSPAMKAKQRIVVRGKVPGQSLPCDRPVEHPADPDTVEIGWSDSEADDSAGEYIHHHHDPIALEQN